MVLSKKILSIAMCFSAGIYACGLFVGRGFEDLRSLPVSISEEETLIVWSESNNRQDFIRKVVFNASVPEFGLLVPVPSRPKVEESSDAIFEILRDEMELQRPRRKEWVFPWTPSNFDGFGAVGGSLGSRNKSFDTLPPGAVTVVEELQVGLFRTQIITATNTEALDEWLQKEGFSLGNEAQKYLQHYVGGEWHWVVFSYKGELSQKTQIESQTFRISFDTQRAFYPYREPDQVVSSSPDNSRHSSRQLRLYVLSENELEGYVESKPESPWPTSLPSSYALFRSPLKFNSKKIAQEIDSFSSQIHLSAFHETIFPQWSEHPAAKRLDGDLFFKSSSVSEPLLLPEKVSTVHVGPYIVLGLLLLALLMGVLALRRMIRLVKKRTHNKL